ncbi:MAG: ABC transporter substrate-binding protein [Chloroflexi bacterium]|nr:ABC transporter substrate-binding protein [Chloroflexota bacterium]
MSRKVMFVLGMLVIVALMLTACAPAPAAKTSGAEKTVTIGFTASQTGKYNVESSRQTNGLKMWVDDVNNAGGIKLSDGTVLKFATKFYDDESNKDRVQELYTRLATEDNANFLISPYSSGLTAAAAVIAEQYGKIMITTGAASDATYKQGYTLVYQAYTPASRYLTSSVDLLGSLDASAKKIAFVYENSKFSTSVVEAAKAYAEAQGYDVVLFEGYDPDTSDFNPFINKIQAASPDAIMGGGHFQDGSTFARQINEKNLPVKFISLLVAPPEPTFSELGDAAVGVAGPSQWEAAAKYSPEAAKAAGMDWLGLSSTEFAQKYEKAYGEAPSYHAAGGYAAGLLLQNAIQKADSIETAKVKAALDATNLMIFFGPLKFDTSADAHGLQVGHSMIVVQWQRDSSGKLVKQVVWPTSGATADPLYPIH